MRKVKHLHKKIISFGQFETATVLINVLLIKVLLGMPQLLCYRAGSAAWLVAIVSGAFFLLVLAGILLLYRRFEGKNIMAVSYTHLIFDIWSMVELICSRFLSRMILDW